MEDEKEYTEEIGSDTHIAGTLDPSGGVPLVFISHDSRDKELADAFSKFIKSVSASMIKTFQSTDKKAGGGIEFGAEWYERLLSKLQSTSDVICLFTERSIGRPWILFEAGIAKGKLGTPVFGLALGIPLNRISTGPFYQFQNMDDSEADLTKLAHQLAERVPGLDPDPDVVKTTITTFKLAVGEILKSYADKETSDADGASNEENSVAKLVEEMKTLPSRVAERLSDFDNPYRRKRNRRFHPMMFEDMLHMSGKSGDPVGVLMAASMVRDDSPWLYEVAMESYRAIKTGKPDLIKTEINRLRRFCESRMFMILTEEYGYDKESHMMLGEFPRLLEHALSDALDVAMTKKNQGRKRVAIKSLDKNET